MKNDFDRDDMISDEDLANVNNITRKNDKNANSMRDYEEEKTKNKDINFGEKKKKETDYYDYFHEMDKKGNYASEKTRSKSIADQSYIEQAPYYGMNPYANSSYSQHYNSKPLYSDDMRPTYLKLSDEYGKPRRDIRHFKDKSQYVSNFVLPAKSSYDNIKNENKRQPRVKICSNCNTTDTPSWRRSSDHRLLLCNACGLYKKLHGRDRPYNVTADGKTKAVKTNIDKLRCRNCHTTETSYWRKGPDGFPLCNHCGLYIRNVMSNYDSHFQESKRRESEPNIRNYGYDLKDDYSREMRYHNNSRFDDPYHTFISRGGYSDISDDNENRYVEHIPISSYSRERGYDSGKNHYSNHYNQEYRINEQEVEKKPTSEDTEFLPEDEEERFYNAEKKNYKK